MGDTDSSAMATKAEKATKAVPAPVMKTIEEWATAKGFLPQELPQENPNYKPAATLTIGSAAVLGLPTRHNPEFWKFAAARAGNGWPNGFEITEAEFDAQIDVHTNLVHG